MLEVDSVQLSFGTKFVLTDVYLKCETGRITGLLGRNGSGKTCLMNLIYGSLQGQNQQVRIDRVPVKSAFQTTGLLTYLPQFSFTPKGLKLKTVFEHYQTSLEQFLQCFPEFNKLKNEKAGNLSGGELRLAEVYCVLNTPSKFTILDEPYSHIMPLYIEKLQHLILEQKTYKGIIISDHLYRSVLNVSDDIYILENGAVHLAKGESDLIRYGYLKHV